MAAKPEVTNIKGFLKVKDHSDGCGIVKDHGDEFKVLNFENEVIVPVNAASGKTTGQASFTGFKIVIPWSKGVAIFLTTLGTNKEIPEIVLTTLDINNQDEAALKATFKHCQIVGHKISMGTGATLSTSQGLESLAELTFTYTDLKYELNSAEGTAKSTYSAD